MQSSGQFKTHTTDLNLNFSPKALFPDGVLLLIADGRKWGILEGRKGAFLISSAKNLRGEEDDEELKRRRT